MDNANNDKRVLVTGSSGGIGRACAVEAARAGYYVICHYNHGEERAKATLEEVKSVGGEGELLQFNIQDREDCKKKLGEIVKKYGALWGIINNAGITRDNTFVGLSGEDWDEVIHTNLDSFYNVLSPLVMSMASRSNKRGGRIIVMSSVSGVYGNRGQVNYAASKAGLIGAAKALAVELAPRNITVNAIAPGVIETSMTEAIRSEVKEAILSTIPMKRMGTVKEVAALAVFLLSSDAGYITRQVIVVNGGMQ